MLGAITTGSGGSNASPTSTAQFDTSNRPAFMPQQCLFCNKESTDFELNMSHMQTSHGLFIPDKQRLIVDLEVLMEYLHLVIYGYNECISCGTMRNSPLAVQQHMLGKSHCRIDIADQDSEFADFWDFSEAESGSDEEATSKEGDSSKEGDKGTGTGIPTQLDDNSIRLPSGRLISKNSPSQQHQRRTEARKQRAAIEATHEAASNSADAASSTALTVASSGSKSLRKSEKREQAFTTQLANLSENDRRSLMHLPTSQQRAILATQQKQAEKAKRAERRYQSRVEGLGNKTLMGHYRADGPSRQNG